MHSLSCSPTVVWTRSRAPARSRSMIESGPASGVWGAAALGRLIGEPNAIAIDIGGTTAKCGLITKGEVKQYQPPGRPLRDLRRLSGLGAGGRPGRNRQRRRVDRLGRRIPGCTWAHRAPGPFPGPVSYGAGGTQATTTDANLALGRINPGYFCGGTMLADMPAVDDALDQLAATLKTGRREAAAASASPTTIWSMRSS